MESGKKQNIIIVLLLVIIVLLLCVIDFFVFDNDKLDNSINSEVNSETNIDDFSEEVNYPDWMQYILNSDINSITLTRNYNINLESSSNRDVNLTKEDLENLFTKFKNYNLIKYNTTGIGVPENQLVISYNYSGKNYNLAFYDSNIRMDNIDEQLMKLLNNSKYADNTGSNPGGIMFTFDDSYDGNIYDIYFQS